MINIDLSILDGDIEFSQFKNPAQLSNNDVIAQDIKHAIIESKKLPLLIGLRNKNAQDKVLTELELIIEQDNRLVPGSIKIVRDTSGFITVTAKPRKVQQ